MLFVRWCSIRCFVSIRCIVLVLGPFIFGDWMVEAILLFIRRILTVLSNGWIRVVMDVEIAMDQVLILDRTFLYDGGS